jgi:hypothetical protein
VANAVLRLSSQLDLTELAMIFKFGTMPYDMAAARHADRVPNFLAR